VNLVAVFRRVATKLDFHAGLVTYLQLKHRQCMSFTLSVYSNIYQSRHTHPSETNNPHYQYTEHNASPFVTRPRGRVNATSVTQA
jgi:hypothetical protein